MAMIKPSLFLFSCILQSVAMDRSAWLHVPELPFFLALLPQWCFRFMKLEVVSYALPALIAVGLCRHVCAAECFWQKTLGTNNCLASAGNT